LFKKIPSIKGEIHFSLFIDGIFVIEKDKKAAPILMALLLIP
jgi:hypothetical protein